MKKKRYRYDRNKDEKYNEILRKYMKLTHNITRYTSNV